MTSANTARSTDITALSERMGYMQALRAGLGLVVVASTLAVPELTGLPGADLLWTTACYLLLTATLEGIRRLFGRGLPLVGGMLMVDGIYLAWVVHATGGPSSPLRFLVYIHLIAVSLLASYRTGLKVALWYSLLLFVVAYAQEANLLEPAASPARRPPAGAVFNLMAFWLVAIGTAFFSRINERELRRRKTDLEALAAMASALERQAGASGVASALLDSAQRTFDVVRGAVLASPDAPARLQLLERRGPGDEPAREIGIDRVVRAAWGTRGPQLLRTIDPEVNPSLAALLPGARNVTVFPLFADGAPTGVLAVEHGQRKDWVERQTLTMLSQFCAHAALALRNAWLLEQVQKMALTDGLTGIANRRAFEDALNKELARAERSGEPVTLIMLDIDNFKALNDKFGHQTGDDVLKKVARVLGSQSRDYDLVARYGGEEFAVILPDCGTPESLEIADRLRRSMSKVLAPVAVTASAGLATYPAHASGGSALIKAADAALYESKHRGRNRLTRSRRRGPAVDGRVAAAPRRASYS